MNLDAPSKDAREQRNQRFGRGWWLIVVVLYTTACSLPVWHDHERVTTMSGWQCLTFYPMAMMHLAWYANVFLICGVIAAAAGGAGELIVVALLSSVLAATFPISITFDSLEIGFWFWASSFAVFLGRAICLNQR